MTDPLCIQLVGLPGSGKSTLRPILMREYGLPEKATVIVSMDDYIHRVKGDRTYAEAFADHVEEASLHVAERIGFARRNRLPTIIDMTNLTAAHRQRNAVALTDHVHIAAVPWVSRNVRLERLAARSEQTIPDHVLAMMERKFSVPSTEAEPWLSAVRYFDCG